MREKIEQVQQENLTKEKMKREVSKRKNNGKLGNHGKKKKWGSLNKCKVNLKVGKWTYFDGKF